MNTKDTTQSSTSPDAIDAAVQAVYGECGLDEADLARCGERASYYAATIETLADRSTHTVPLGDWLTDETCVAELLGQPVGSMANFAIVRDISQGWRLRGLQTYAADKGGELNRQAFIDQQGQPDQETELLLARLAQLESAPDFPYPTKIGQLLCNAELKEAIERFCSEPYVLTVDDPRRITYRLGKLWAGSKGPQGMWAYNGITEQQVVEMGIGEAEVIKGVKEVFTGENLLFFFNEQMSTLEPLAGLDQPVSAYKINLLFPQLMGQWAYDRFDGYQPYTIKQLFSGPAISTQIHRSKGYAAKPETFILLLAHPKYGQMVVGIKPTVPVEDIVRAIQQRKAPNGPQRIIELLNILSAEHGQLNPRDVFNIEGETVHSLGAYDVLQESDQVWQEQFINCGIIGILEIAYNQFALSPKWIDPATLRAFDDQVDRVKSLIGAQVEARHMDDETIIECAAELKRHDSDSAVTRPDVRSRFGTGEPVEQAIYRISDHYHFAVLHLNSLGDPVVIDDLHTDDNAAYNVITAQGIPNPEGAIKQTRERIQVSLTGSDGPAASVILKRGEGLFVPAGFHGKIEVRALDAGAWAVRAMIPFSERPPAAPTDLFIRTGIRFHATKPRTCMPG